MIIEARRNARKQQSSIHIPSPFTHKSNSPNNKTKTRFKEVESILKNPQQ